MTIDTCNVIDVCMLAHTCVVQEETYTLGHMQKAVLDKLLVREGEKVSV